MTEEKERPITSDEAVDRAAHGSALRRKSSRQAAEEAVAKSKDPNAKWAVVLTICHEHGIGQFIANTSRPYRVPDVRTAHKALGKLGNQVVVADKATLMANGFDLCERDFDEPLELPAMPNDH